MINKKHKGIAPSWFVSELRAAGDGVILCGCFLGTFFGLCSTSWALFQRYNLPEYGCCTYPSLIMYPSSSRTVRRVTKLTSSQSGFLNTTVSLICSNGLNTPDLNSLGYGGTEDLHHEYAATHLQRCDAIVSTWTKISRMFALPCWIFVTKH